MKRSGFLTLASLLLLLLLGGFYWIANQNWALGDKYTVKFSNPDVTGTFDKMNAKIVFDEQNLKSASFDVTINVASANTGSAEMNGTVTAPDMLDKTKFPTIRFVSSAVSGKPGAYVTRGLLELHGVKKEVEIPFRFEEHVFKGAFEIKGEDYGLSGLGKGENGKVKIELSVPVKPLN